MDKLVTVVVDTEKLREAIALCNDKEIRELARVMALHSLDFSKESAHAVSYNLTSIYEKYSFLPGGFAS